MLFLKHISIIIVCAVFALPHSSVIYTLSFPLSVVYCYAPFFCHYHINNYYVSFTLSFVWCTWRFLPIALSHPPACSSSPACVRSLDISVPNFPPHSRDAIASPAPVSSVVAQRPFAKQGYQNKLRSRGYSFYCGFCTEIPARYRVGPCLLSPIRL